MSDDHLQIMGRVMQGPRTDSCGAYAAELRALLAQARCPNANCDGGTLLTARGDGEWDEEPCQWCEAANSLLAPPAPQTDVPERGHAEELEELRRLLVERYGDKRPEFYGTEAAIHAAREHLAVNALLAEVQALRRGIGVSYASTDEDPVRRLHLLDGPEYAAFLNDTIAKMERLRARGEASTRSEVNNRGSSERDAVGPWNAVPAIQWTCSECGAITFMDDPTRAGHKTICSHFTEQPHTQVHGEADRG